MLFQQFYNLIDTMIVGRSLGEKRWLRLVLPVRSTLDHRFCSGVCAGFAIPMAQALGGKKKMP